MEDKHIDHSISKKLLKTNTGITDKAIRMDPKQLHLRKIPSKRAIGMKLGALKDPRASQYENMH